MHAVLSLVVFTLALQTAAAFDAASFFDAIKEKFESIKASSNSSDDFHARLEAIRERVKERLRENTTAAFNETKLREILKKIAGKVRDHIRPTGDNVEEVNRILNVSGNYYQGDMILTKEQADALAGGSEVSKRQAFIAGTVGYKWSTVYYSYANSLPSHTKTVSELAVKFWQQHTCLNFQQSSKSERVSVISGSGCYSYIGQIGGAQELSLGSGCDSVGTAAHEWGHALGFYHTQSRHDRDSHITLQEANVESGWIDQFDKETTKTNNNYGMPYDYGSVMHYAGDSASGNGQPTMVANVETHQDTMGSDIVSFVDVSMMNELYDCKSKCASSSIKCENGGFPHPRDCSKCLCPGGYGGDLCNERPTGCGATLTASTSSKTLTHKVGNGTRSVQDEYVFCNWMIVAPSTSNRIKVTVKSYTSSSCSAGCVYGGLELKWQSDPTLTGSRYCCSNDVGETVTSQTNVLPVIAFNRYASESFTITYQII